MSSTTPTGPTGGPSRRIRFRGTGQALASLVVVAFLAAACSGGSPSATVANTGSTTSAAPNSSGSGSHSGLTVAYSQCMRTHGVPNFPDPNSQGAISGSGSSASGINPHVTAVPGSPEVLRQTCAERRNPGPTGTELGPGPEVCRLHALSRHVELPRPDLVEWGDRFREHRHQPRLAAVPGGVEDVPTAASRRSGDG